MEKSKYYRMNIHPFKPLINAYPNEYVVNIEGDVFMITEKLKYRKILTSCLQPNETIDQLTFPQFKLFYAITRNRINHIYKNIPKTQQDGQL